MKTNATTAGSWLMGKHTPVSETHIHVVINLQPKKSSEPEYFILPSGVVKEPTQHGTSPNAKWHMLYRKDILEYRGKWDIFGDPRTTFQVEEQDAPPGHEPSGDADVA